LQVKKNPWPNIQQAYLFLSWADSHPLVNPLYIYPGPDHTGAKYVSFEGKKKRKGEAQIGVQFCWILFSYLSHIFLLASQTWILTDVLKVRWKYLETKMCSQIIIKCNSTLIPFQFHTELILTSYQEKKNQTHKGDFLIERGELRTCKTTVQVSNGNWARKSPFPILACPNQSPWIRFHFIDVPSWLHASLRFIARVLCHGKSSSWIRK
jgi:hypothetical protein